MSQSKAPEDAGEAPTFSVAVSQANAPTADGDRAPPAAGVGALGRGAAVGRYLILSLLGRGGMGAVYAAFDPELDRRVALKLLHTAGGYESAGKLLAREARVLGQLSHPNVVQVHDVGEHGGDVFVAMELVEGESLDAWCLRPPRPGWQAVLAAYVDAARGLSAAHAKGVVHRDVKPANILRGKDGRVRVVDFGIAVGLAPGDAGAAAAEPIDAMVHVRGGTGGSASERLTEAGVVMGTPLYMAPEQVQPEGASPASDQYALCASLHEGLYGAPPATIDRKLPPPVALTQLFAQKRAGAPAAAPAGTAVPAWVFKALARGLAPAPEDRYPSMEALIQALGADPAAPRRAFWRMAGVGMAAGALLAFATFGWARNSLHDPCAHPERHLAGVWDEGVRARVRAAFAGTGRPGAEGTTTRVLALLDRAAAAYAAMRGEVCEASRTGKQRPEILDLRDACLAHRRGELEALASLFAEKPDPQVLDRAVAAAAGLHPVAYCADIEALTARVRPPEDPALRARVGAIQPRVDRLATLYATAKYREALALAEPLLLETAAVPYPPLHAQVQFWAGRMKEGIGEYEAAKTLLRDAAVSAADGGDDVLVANALARLLFVVAERQRRFDEGTVLRTLGAVAVARAHDERMQGTWVNAEGLLLWRMGKYADAKATFERALGLREKVLGPDHPDVAQTMNNLGLVLLDMGDPALSVATHERTLSLRERVLGPDHPDVAQSLNNLAIALYRKGDYPRAQAAYERSAALREKALGPDHPDVAQSLGNLANLFGAMGSFALAVTTYERALAIYEKALGPDHPEVAGTLDDMGTALYDLGSFARAKASHERALAILEKALGPEHVDVAYALQGLGRAQVALGELDAARTSLERARALREKALGPSHPRLATALLGLAELSLARRKPEEAVALLERALALVDDDEKPDILRTLAEAHWRLGKDRARARALAEQARAAYERAGHRPGLARMTRWLAEHGTR